jgi:hypothetical protein
MLEGGEKVSNWLRQRGYEVIGLARERALRYERLRLLAPEHLFVE